MKQKWSCLALFAVALVVAGCSSTKFVSSEKAENVGPVDLTGKKVIALVIDPREEIRTKAENALAKELSKRGLAGIAAHTLIAPEVRNDKDQALAAIHASGAEALVTVRLVGIQEEDQYVPAVYDHDIDFYGVGWGVTYAPGYFDSFSIFTVETLCYRVADEKLLWTGLSETVDPDDLNDMVHSLVKEAGKVMTKQGLTKKK